MGLPGVVAAESFVPFSYGATGDGVTLDTAAVQRTIDAAASSGTNNEVVIPQGFSFLVGTLVLRSGIDFHVDGALIISTNHADYSGDGVIIASNVTELTVSGAGSMAGRSLAFTTSYDRAGEWWLCAPWRPKMFMLTGCANMTIRDLTFGDSPYWGLHMLGCSNVLVENVTVRNRLDVPNCDGIDADHCQQVEIRNCDVIAGDDAIVVKNTRQARDFGPCQNIYVHDCVVQSQDSGLKIGTETASDARAITFAHCRVTSAGRGLTIQLRDEGSVSNVVFSDIQFLSRYFADPWWGHGEGISLTALPRTAQTKLGMMQDILFTNITGRSENSLRINGSPGSHIQNVRMESVYVTVDRWTKYPGGRYDNRPTTVLEPLETHGTAGLSIRYADGVVLRNVTLRWGKKVPNYFTSALETDHATGVELWDFKGGSAHPGRYEDMLLQ